MKPVPWNTIFRGKIILLCHSLSAVDRLTPENRSQLMSRIRSENTQPELIVRRLLWRMGYRYRTHPKDLPCKPDIVFRGRRQVVFVHGCFWHRHQGCERTAIPKTKESYWLPKFDRTVQRDKDCENRLREIGWSVLVVWECETKNLALLESKLRDFMSL